MADTKNAHVRSQSSKRETPDVQASEAQRLLADPAYIRGFDAVRNGLINELEHLKHDGSTEMDDYERELCRSLRTLICTKRAMNAGVQGQKLREAGFRAHDPEPETNEG